MAHQQVFAVVQTGSSSGIPVIIDGRLTLIDSATLAVLQGLPGVVVVQQSRPVHVLAPMSTPIHRATPVHVPLLGPSSGFGSGPGPALSRYEAGQRYQQNQQSSYAAMCGILPRLPGT